MADGVEFAILAVLNFRHVLAEMTHDYRDIYVLYNSNVLVTTRTPMAGFVLGYEQLLNLDNLYT